MSKKGVIAVIKENIKLKEKTLGKIKSGRDLLNSAIPKIEGEIKEEKTRLAGLEGRCLD